MTTTKVAALTALSMIAFAANSILCRIALSDTGIDATSFTSIRLTSGALTLWIITCSLPKTETKKTDLISTFISAFMLFIYATGFSLAYTRLSVATGALILFGAIQITMMGYGIYTGESLKGKRLLGFILAISGLIAILLPGVSTPAFTSSALMLCSGIAWGVYSLRGKRISDGVSDPIRITAKNFLASTPFALILSLFFMNETQINQQGLIYAILSGAIASGLGYSIWYATLPYLKATNAAAVQLSVPVIAALGGIIFLCEPITLRFFLASVLILGGIFLVILEKSKK